METQISADNTKQPRVYPGRKMISLVLPDELVAAIDAHAKHWDLSRTWIIRKVLEGWAADKEAGF